MKKSLIQGFVSLSLFFGTWFVLGQMDWLKVFKVQQVTEKTEEKLGALLWRVFKGSEEEPSSPHLLNTIDSLITHICKANKIDRYELKIHILNKDEINAFALPDGHLVIYSGLISNADNQEELSGVLCHEIAHIELNHVMKKLLTEFGLSTLIGMTSGGVGTEIIKETAKVLSSSAFDRQLEEEADIKAVDYMQKAQINPEPFANFLFKLSNSESEELAYISWIGTHPDSKDRARYILEYSKGKGTTYKAILSSKTWDTLQDEL